MYTCDSVMLCDLVEQVEKCAELARSFTPLSQGSNGFSRNRSRTGREAGAVFPGFATRRLMNQPAAHAAFKPVGWTIQFVLSYLFGHIR
jgi:hypothetical protein